MKLDADVREITRGMLISASTKVFAVACSYLLNIVLARMLGSEKLGFFSLAFTIVVSLAFMGRFGLDYVMLRHSAIFWTTNQKATLAAWFRKALGLTGITTAIMTVCLLFWGASLSASIFSMPGLASPLFALAFAIIPQTLLFIQAETLKGAGFIKTSQVLQGDGGGVAVYGPALCLCLPLAYLGGVVGACWGFTLASWAAFFMGWAATVRTFERKKAENPPAALFLLRLGLPLFIASVMSLVVARAAVVMLGIWSTASVVGIFAISQRLALLGSNVQTACCTVMGPKIATMYASGDTESLAGYYRRSTRLVWILAFCVLGCVIAAAPWIMALLGDDFSSGTNLLRLLALGELCALLFGPVSLTLIVTGHGSQHCKSVMTAAAVMLVSGGCLIPACGAFGAALAVILGTVVQSITQAFYIRRLLGFFPWAFGRSARHLL